MRAYLKKLLPFSIAVALFIYVLAQKFSTWGDLSTWYSVFAFFFVVSVVFHLLITDKATDDKIFVRKFMLATVLRLLTYLFLIVLVFLYKQESARNFTLIFLCQYILFFPFDTIVLFIHTRKKQIEA
jgi:hypothetical protein